MASALMLSAQKHLNKYLSYYFMVGFVLTHLLYINTPFVNHEWTQRLGIQAALRSDPTLLDTYFGLQTNTLIYSFVSGLALPLLGDSFAAYRVFSLIGGILLLALLARRKMPFLVLIVGLNPLIWIYTGRALPELISVGLMLLAMDMPRSGIKAGLVGALSAAIKPNSIVVCGSHWGVRWAHGLYKQRALEWRDPILLAGVVAVAGFVVFLVAYYLATGVWIVPDKFQAGLAPSYDSAVNNIFSYGFYLGAMFVLTVPFHVRNTPWRWQLAMVVVSVLLAMSNQNLGEMNFGSFNYVFGADLIFVIKVVGFWNFLICIFHFWKKDESRVTLVTILFYIVFLSFSRPTQRYLIFVIPLWATLICRHIELRQILRWGYLSMLVGLNIVATMFQVSNAVASERIAEWSRENDIFIRASIIYSHVGPFSHHDPQSATYVALSVEPEDEVLTAQDVAILGYPLKTFYVVRRP